MSAGRRMEPPWRHWKQLSLVHTQEWPSRQKSRGVSWDVCQALRPLATQALVKWAPLHAPPPTRPTQSIRIIDTNICKLAFRRARRWKHLVKLCRTTLNDLKASRANGEEDSRGAKTRLWISVFFHFFFPVSVGSLVFSCPGGMHLSGAPRKNLLLLSQ